jgi:hypothetical protein
MFGLLVLETKQTIAVDGRVTSTICKYPISKDLPWIEVWEVKEYDAEIRGRIDAWVAERSHQWSWDWRLVQMVSEINQYIRWEGLKNGTK